MIIEELENFKIIIRSKNIFNGVIDLNILEKLREFSSKELAIIFDKFIVGEKTKNGIFFEIDLSCECGSKITKKINKTKVFLLINRKGKIICEKCIKQEKATEDFLNIFKRADEDEKRRKEIEGLIDKYDFLLNPQKSLPVNMNIVERFREVEYVLDRLIRCSPTANTAIKKHIKSLRYKDFLITPYWKAISAYVKLKANFMCKICSSKENLNTHHRTYVNHGDELNHWKEDLICLCNKCHDLFSKNGKLAKVDT